MNHGFNASRRALRSLAFIALIFFHSQSLHASVRYLLDFDGTLVNDHGPDAGWRTYWILKRVEQRHTSLQPDPQAVGNGKYESPEFLEVAFSEYQRLLPLLAKEESLLGDLNPFNLDFDPVFPNRPKTVVPGFYRISPDISFRQFRPNPGGDSYLLKNYSEARKRQRQSRGSMKWMGPAFPLLQAGLKEASQVDSVVLSTARHFSESEFFAWLAELKTDKLIAHVQGKDARGRKIAPRLHSLHGPDAVLFGRALVERKVQVLTLEAQQLLASPLPRHQELVTDEFRAAEGVTAAYHTLITAEDDPRIVQALSAKMGVLSSDIFFSQKMKFVLFNTGDAAEIATARWPWRWTVFDRGFGREARLEEIALWTKRRSEKTCLEILKG